MEANGANTKKRVASSCFNRKLCGSERCAKDKDKHNKSLDVRAKQRLSFHVASLPLTCVYSVSPHVNSIVRAIPHRLDPHPNVNGSNAIAIERYKRTADRRPLQRLVQLNHDDTGAVLRGVGR